MRTGKTEFQHIEHIVKRIALTRPDVQIELKHNQKVCARYLRVKDINKRIEQVCGKNMLLNSTPIDYRFDGIVLSGVCSKLGHGEATRDLQYTFVNGRMMRDKLLTHALRQVYEDTLPSQTFASYVLYLQVSPEQIDVNVHPAKHEVRFHQSRQVHDIVFKAVNDAISRQAYIQGEDDSSSFHTPNHNYIQALEPAIKSDSPQAGLHASDLNNGANNALGDDVNNHVNDSPVSISKASFGPGRGAQYRHSTPTKSEIKANYDFYKSVETSQISNIAQQNNSHNTSDVGGWKEPSALSKEPSGSLKKTSAMQSYMYNAPYIVISRGECLQVLPINNLLASIVSHRIQRSTLAQPLLMPIAIENKVNIKQTYLDELAPLNMTMSASHQKLILKQVPSELRHLPWASVFAQLDINALSTNAADIDILAKRIAQAWLSTLEVSSTMLDGWMNELGEHSIHLLCEKYGKSLHLATWIKND